MTLAPAWSRFSLFATAFITGAVVMALEILGSRLLAPVFGNSLFVWGALIGVILAAMSSGYAMGGWLADRHSGKAVLAGLLWSSGAWTFLLAWKGHPVMFAVAEWIQDPRWGPCLAASLLLAPPAFCLSGALPALLRLSIDDMGHLGRHTGRMIAVSTVGSLVGTWGTAFFLLSWLGSMTLVAWLGAIQIVLGLFWWWHGIALRTRTAARAAGSLVLLGTGLGLGWLALHPDLVLPAPVYQEDSPYQQLRVRDTDLLRYLILDRTFHAVMWRVDPIELALPYSHMMMVALALLPGPLPAGTSSPALSPDGSQPSVEGPSPVSHPTWGLILGHGGGSLAKWLARYWPELSLDVVEVDPSVVQAAERYFDYHPSPRHQVHVQDARIFLRQTDRRYDVIWVDVFARHLIPFHLTTEEFFAEVRSHLTPGGVLAVNLASSGDGPDLQRAQAVVTTMQTAFPLIQTFAVKGDRGAENLIFFAGASVAQMGQASFSDRVNRLVEARRMPVEAAALLAGRRDRPWDPGVVLTDDYAPFDLLMGRGEALGGAGGP